MIHKAIVLFALSLAVTAAQAVSTIKPPPPWAFVYEWAESLVKKPASGPGMIVLPWPPTVNTYYRNVAGRAIISEKGRAYRQAVAELAAAQKWPKFGAARLSVQIEAWMPDKRRRDLDNLLKSLLDSLTHAGVWDNDSQIDGLAIWRSKLIGGMCKVQITEVA